MRTLALIGVSSVALLLAFGTACGPAPIPVNAGRALAAPPAHSPSVGQATSQTVDPRFAGHIRLRGSLASLEEGFLFASVMPEGVRMPCLSRKIDLSTARIERSGNEAIVPFSLDRAHIQGGLVPGELVFQARFDPDGFVDTKEPEVSVATVPVQVGDMGIEIVLEAAAAPGTDTSGQ